MTHTKETIANYIMTSSTSWPDRFALAQGFDEQSAISRNELIKEGNYPIHELRHWHAFYSGWENGITDDGDIMRFIRGGVVKKIHDNDNTYPENARYTFRVAVRSCGYWSTEEVPSFWDIRILSYAECQQLGFNPITGTSDIYPFINVGTSAEYLEISNSYKNVIEQRRQHTIEAHAVYPKQYFWKQIKQAYLNSTEWKKFAWRVRMYYKQTCQLCGATNCRLDVHHHSGYEMIGRGTFDDVAPLCRACHADEHGIPEATS